MQSKSLRHGYSDRSAASLLPILQSISTTTSLKKTNLTLLSSGMPKEMCGLSHLASCEKRTSPVWAEVRCLITSSTRSSPKTKKIVDVIVVPWRRQGSGYSLFWRMWEVLEH
ncbi:hypothetical protein CABS01_16685 [Colletotrichum abscissum]|uniref:uncharacterized protein n=1 Tax=Colletotrichum abscissum TaxID=1671311 RepID=UPI0027D5DDBC|nr:uncharacterized protein CABS01_16685 [Colletotrichum abscissum]KAK1517223.1 hypothetical protein CABS01_16685 [Colletotrichum abscissum]